MARYPRVDLQALADDAGVALDPALEALRALYADVDARNARNTRDLDLPCGRGCSGCCEESVFMTPLEFLGAWDHAQKTLDDDTIGVVIDNGLAIYRREQARIDAFMRPPPDNARDHFAIAKDLKFRCPLLDQTGACRVYPMRELLGRVFGCSFNDVEGGLYACHLVGAHLDGQTVTLLPARGTARRLHDLPLTGFRQVYPWFLNWLYGPDGIVFGAGGTPESESD